MPVTDSPLRYPGGKSKLYETIKPIISRNIYGKNRTYIEPFAGGAGLALRLLFNADVDLIILNDIDYHVFCFWNACLNNAQELCNLISDCNINMDTWTEQKKVYSDPFNYTCIEVAFSTFFLNRCNVSGILTGGPIGGHNQTGNYRLDARFNKKKLIEKIYRIYNEREKIRFYNLDAKDFLEIALKEVGYNESILNIDPPYVKKGPILYENSFSKDDHTKLSEIIKKLKHKWIVTYDECDTIYSLYSKFRKELITLSYSIGDTKSGRELIIYSDSIDLNFAKVQ